MVVNLFPLPGVVHDKRILATVVETRAKEGTNTEPWVSIPINDNDLSAGFRDITFQQLNNAANHAARWLSQALPTTPEPFQHFAYAGPKDLRYAFLAVAAAKLQKVVCYFEGILLGNQLGSGGEKLTENADDSSIAIAHARGSAAGSGKGKL